MGYAEQYGILKGNNQSGWYANPEPEHKNMKLTKDIQKKILEASYNFNTDSDLKTFSKETGISFDDILRVILNNADVFEPCNGCLHIINRVYPLTGTTCENCSRANKLEDCYVADLRFIEED